MAKKKYKRLTQREKDERAASRKRLQAEGLLPPRKPILNRRKFAADVMAEYKSCGRFICIRQSRGWWMTR